MSSGFSGSWREALSRWLAIAMLGLVAGSAVHAQAPAQAPARAPEDFWIAVSNDRAADVKKFLGRGVSPNAVNGVSNTPLLEAIKADAWNTYDVLLADKRIDVNVRNQLGESPLMYLAIKADLERSKALIARGAEVNQPGWTALHYAATVGADDIVRLLIENYAYIDAESPNKTTPLMMAMRYDKTSTVKLLLDEGADGYAKNDEGKNAVDVGRDAHNSSLADALAERLNADKRRKAGMPAR